VYVQLACAEGSDAPTRLREPQVIFRYIAGPGTGDVTAWVRASEAAQLAVIFARLGHRELSGLVASAAEVAVTEVHA
jgi:hypothetical protein